MQVLLTPAGLILKNGLEKFIKFGETPDEMAGKLLEIHRGTYRLPNEILEILGDKRIETTSPQLREIIRRATGRTDIKLIKETEDPTPILAQHLGLKTTQIYNLLKEVMTRFTEMKLREELANKDLLVIQAINAYDEYTEMINIIYERLREWYGIYFPELSKIVRKIESYAHLIATLGRRDRFTERELSKYGYSKDRIREIVDAARRSSGAELTPRELEVIMEQAETLKTLIRQREEIEEHISELVTEIAPNTTALIGPKLTARLIAKAGGLRKLAMFPASTIQLLGAEKALFLALRKGGKPPKHGIIFQHPYINQSPRSVRGKIARLLAGKIAIAIRTDVFGGEYIGDKLAEEVKAKVEEIRKRAPKKKIKKKRVKKRWRSRS